MITGHNDASDLEPSQPLGSSLLEHDYNIMAQNIDVSEQPIFFSCVQKPNETKVTRYCHTHGLNQNQSTVVREIAEELGYSLDVDKIQPHDIYLQTYPQNFLSLINLCRHHPTIMDILIPLTKNSAWVKKCDYDKLVENTKNEINHFKRMLDRQEENYQDLQLENDELQTMNAALQHQLSEALQEREAKSLETKERLQRESQEIEKKQKKLRKERAKLKQQKRKAESSIQKAKQDLLKKKKPKKKKTDPFILQAPSPPKTKKWYRPYVRKANYHLRRVKSLPLITTSLLCAFSAGIYGLCGGGSNPLSNLYASPSNLYYNESCICSPYIRDYVDDTFAQNLTTSFNKSLAYKFKNLLNVKDMLHEKKQIALHKSVQQGDIETIQFLTLFTDIDINAEDERNQTALHYAALKEDSSIINFLAHQRAHLNHQSIDGYTPLMAAIAANRTKNVHILTQFYEVVKGLTIRNNRGETALIMAVQSGKLNILTHLTTLGKEFHIPHLNIQNENGATPLMLASITGQFNMVRHLIEEKADLYRKSREGLNVLMWCIASPQEKSVAIARFLVNYDKDLLKERGKSNTTPLILAVAFEFTEMITFFVEEADVNINEVNAYGMNALMMASHTGNKAHMNYLIAHGADKTQQDIYGHSALSYATGKRKNKNIWETLNTIMTQK